MYQIPATIHLAVARELDGSFSPMDATNFYRNWGKVDKTDARIRDLIFPVGDSPVFERCARIAKAYVLSGGLHIPERITTMANYLHDGDFGFRPFTMDPAFMPNVFLGCLVGTIEAAHFLTYELAAVYLVEEEDNSNCALTMQKRIRKAALNCLDLCLAVLRDVSSDRGMPEKKERARISAMLKDFFRFSASGSDKMEYSRDIEKLITDNPPMNGNLAGGGTLFEFMIRELFYCRIHLIPYEEMHRFIENEAKHRLK